MNGWADLIADVTSTYSQGSDASCGNASEWVHHDVTLVCEVLDAPLVDLDWLAHDLTINLDLLLEWSPDVTAIGVIELGTLQVVDGSCLVALEGQDVDQLVVICVE
jgi:hypothetical protein